MMRIQFPTLVFLAAAAAVTASPRDARARAPHGLLAAMAPVSKKTAASATGSVHIRAVATEIEVVGTSKKEVSITGELPDGYELELDSKKSHTEIKVKPPRHSSRTGKLKIEVPRGSSIDVKNVSGNVTATNVTGETSLETVSGTVASDGSGAEVHANSVSGKVAVRGGSKRTSARTVSGTIEIEKPGGRVSATSVSGNVKVHDGKVSRANLTSVSGALFFDGVLGPQGPHELKTHSGRIELRLPPSAPVDIHASTHAGSIRSELGDAKARRKARITVGEGGPTVTLRTFAGGITIEAR